jgi:hypothetical protein
MPLPVALAVLLLAQLFDWASFLVLIARHGLGAEANPIVVTLVEETGLSGVTLAKVATVTFVASLAVLIARRRPRIAILLVILSAVAGLVGGLSNIAVL